MDKRIITIEDIEATWGLDCALDYFIEVLNGEYKAETAREDILSLIDTKHDSRVKKEKNISKNLTI